MTILRRGQNVHPPAVGVVYDAWVTKAGSVLGDDVFISMWPDTFNLTEFRHQYFPTAQNQVGLQSLVSLQSGVLLHLHSSF